MLKDDLKRLVNERKFTLDELNKWIDHLPNYTPNRTVDKINKGDVLFHPIFQHPIVVLKVHKQGVICSVLTTEPKCVEILEPCRSRMFNNSYITTNLIMVKDYHDLKLRGLYDNNRHLTKVYNKLKNIFN